MIELVFDFLISTPAFIGLTLAGMLITLWYMQVSSHYLETRGACASYFWAHRILFTALATVYLWMLSFALNRDWQPWPPMVLMICIVNLILLLIAGRLYREMRVAKSVCRIRRLQ